MTEPREDRSWDVQGSGETTFALACSMGIAEGLEEIAVFVEVCVDEDDEDEECGQHERVGHLLSPSEARRAAETLLRYADSVELRIELGNEIEAMAALPEEEPS